MRRKGRKTYQKKKSGLNKIEKFFLRFIAIIISVVIFVTVLIGIAVSKISNDSIPKGDNPSFFGGNINILLMGVDIGDVNQVENESIKRTDTLMLLNYNPNSKGVNLVSIPRDTLIKINGKNHKMNSAYAIGSYSRLETEVEKLLDIDINYTVKIDYNAFREFIDAIGGVNVTILNDMYYDDDVQNLHINFKKGDNINLDGEGAEEFFRWRQNNDGTGLATGDLGRIENQQDFIKKVFDKLKKPSIIFRVPFIIDAFADNMETNIPSSRVIPYGFKYLIHSGNVNMTTLMGDLKMIDGQSYVVYNEEYNKDILNALGENANPISNINYNIKIKVLNGTNVVGLAGKTREKLQGNGYSLIDAGNTVDTKKSVILAKDKDGADNIKKIANIDNIKSMKDKEEYSEYDVIVIIGDDFRDKF